MDKLKSTGNDMEDFDDAELEELYSWIDGIPLSRPKRNIARDFSDGVLVAELVKCCCCVKGLVQMHNYSAANSTKQKEDNWNTLNSKVFKKLNFELGDDVIRDVITAKPGVIEKVLMMLRVKLNRAEWELKRNPPKSKGGGKKESDKPEADQYMGSPRGKAGQNKADTARGAGGYLQEYKGNKPDQRPDFPTIPKQKIIRSIAESDSVPRILYEDKEQECLAKDETIRILEAKIHRMEHLVHLKDVRIDDLQNTMESLRPTGVRR